MKSYVHQKQKIEVKRQDTFAMNLKNNNHAKNYFITSSHHI